MPPKRGEGLRHQLTLKLQASLTLSLLTTPIFLLFKVTSAWI